MRTLTSAYPSPRIYWIPAVAILIASCSSTGFNMNSLTGPANTPPAYQADQIVGKYGLAAYQRAVLEVAVDADALTQPLCHDLLVGHVDELVLEGGAACVNNKNFHVSYPFSCK